MLNQVQIIGRLGADPEVKQLPGGDSVCNLTVATSERWKDKNTGEQKEKTEWHRIVLFGRVADIAGQYLRKGSMAFFQGKLETRMWEKDGEKRYTTEIRANQLTMLGGKEDSGGQAGAAARPAQSQNQYQQQSQSAAQQQDSFDEEIPF